MGNWLRLMMWERYLNEFLGGFKGKKGFDLTRAAPLDGDQAAKRRLSRCDLSFRGTETAR